jgi:L-rhamnose mutarotase
MNKHIQRLAFKMHLKPGQRETYKQRHNAIWPELKRLLQEAGISEYSIFLDEETNTLFAFQKVEGNAGSQDLSEHLIVKKWWNIMADIMEVNPDNSPVSVPLEEVFYLK